MKRLGLLILCAAPLFAAGSQVGVGDPRAREASGPRLLELAPGVHALLQPRADRFNDANSLVVIGKSSVAVVDPPSRPAAQSVLIDGIRRLTETPVGFIINTHWHPDHTEGNHVVVEAFGGEIEIVGHETLAVEVPERAATMHEEERARYEEVLPKARQQLVDGRRMDGSPLTDDDRRAVADGIAHAETWLAERTDSSFLAPTKTYADRLTLDLGSRKLELHHLEGHTAGDTVVHLPDLGIVASGDLLDELPYVGHGYPSAWIESLERLGKLEPTRVVPGHGPLFHGREALDRELGYLRDLVGQVEAAIESGATVEQAADSIDLSDWRAAMARDPQAERFFDAVQADAIHRAWAELTGTLDSDQP